MRSHPHLPTIPSCRTLGGSATSSGLSENDRMRGGCVWWGHREQYNKGDRKKKEKEKASIKTIRNLEGNYKVDPGAYRKREDVESERTHREDQRDALRQRGSHTHTHTRLMKPQRQRTGTNTRVLANTSKYYIYNS
ncbi:unnamed protein product [Leuciscus chuanchicus]